jgi:hypothetical protein
MRAAAALRCDLRIAVISEREVDLRAAEGLLRVEVGDEIVVVERDVFEHDALPGIKAGEFAGLLPAAAHEHALRSGVFQQDEVLKAEGDDAALRGKRSQQHLTRLHGGDAQRFERLAAAGGKSLLRRLVARIELIDDVDRLRGDAEIRHEEIKLDHLPLILRGAADEEIKLHAEEDLLLGCEQAGELLRTLGEVLRLLQRFKIQAPHVRVDRLGVIVAQIAEGGLHILLLDTAFEFGKGREDLDEHGQHRIRRDGGLAAAAEVLAPQILHRQRVPPGPRRSATARGGLGGVWIHILAHARRIHGGRGRKDKQGTPARVR